MTIIASIDPTTSPRRIYLHSDTVGIPFQPMDAYKEMRTLRATDETLRHYDVYMTSQGNEPTGPSTATPRRVRMENSVFVPANTDHILTVIGEVITSAGGSGVSAFDRTPLDLNTTVDINYIPPQVEILYINTGSGVTTQDKLDIASGVWASSTRALTVSSGMSPAIEAKINAIPTNPLLATDHRLDNIDIKTSDIWNAPINPNSLVSGSMGEWIMKKLLSINKFIALK